MNFRQRSDPELDRLAKEDEERLLAYIVEARRADRIEAATRGAQILAWSYEKKVRAFVLNRLGSKGPLVVEELAELHPHRRGRVGREVRGVDDRRVPRARLHASPAGGSRTTSTRSGSARSPSTSTGARARRSATRPTRAATTRRSAIEDSSVWNQAFEELNDSHKLVICLVRFYDLPHKKVAEQVNRHFKGQLPDPMTEQNVNQINSRFDKRLDELLREADDPQPPDDDD